MVNVLTLVDNKDQATQRHASLFAKCLDDKCSQLEGNSIGRGDFQLLCSLRLTFGSASLLFVVLVMSSLQPSALDRFVFLCDCFNAGWLWSGLDCQKDTAEATKGLGGAVVVVLWE